jgi:hypothetical protein
MILALRQYHHTKDCPILLMPETNMHDTIEFLAAEMVTQNHPNVFFLLDPSRPQRFGVITNRERKVALTNDCVFVAETCRALVPWDELIAFDNIDRVSPLEGWKALVVEMSTFHWRLTPKLKLRTVGGRDANDDRVMALLMAVAGTRRFQTYAQTFIDLYRLNSFIDAQTVAAVCPGTPDYIPAGFLPV